MKNSKIVKFSAATVAAVAVAGGIAIAANSGSADPASEPSAAELVLKSPILKQADPSAPRLDAGRAQRIDVSRAPAGIANGSQIYVLVPSDKGPCIFRTGGAEVADKLTEGDSLGCGAGIAPTVAITADGTVGVVADKSETVDLIASDGSSAPATIDALGVWFAAPDVTKAIVKSDGSAEQVVELTHPGN